MPRLSKALGLVALAVVFLASARADAGKCPDVGNAPDERVVTITRVVTPDGDSLKVDAPCLQIKAGKHNIHWIYADPNPGDPLIVWKGPSPFDRANTPKHVGKKVRSGKASRINVPTVFSYSVVVAVPGKDPIVLDPDVEVIP